MLSHTGSIAYSQPKNIKTACINYYFETLNCILMLVFRDVLALSWSVVAVLCHVCFIILLHFYHTPHCLTVLATHPSLSFFRLPVVSPVPVLLHFLDVFPLAGSHASSSRPRRPLLQPQRVAVLLQRAEGGAHHPQVVFVALAGLGGMA